MEGDRRSTGVPAKKTKNDPEVVSLPKRRRLSTAYKLRVLDTVSDLRSRGNGAVGAYLRTEGLYYSSIRKWERQRAEGHLNSRSKGRREKIRERLVAENKKLRRQLEHMQKRLDKREMIVDL